MHNFNAEDAEIPQRFARNIFSAFFCGFLRSLRLKQFASGSKSSGTATHLCQGIEDGRVVGKQGDGMADARRAIRAIGRA